MPTLDPQLVPARRAAADASPQPAGLVRRGCAMAIDLAFAVLIGSAARALLRAIDAEAWLKGTWLGNWILERPELAWSLSFVLPAWLVLAAFEARPRGAGPGKRALRLVIAAPRAEAPPSFARAAARTAIKLVPWHIAALALLFPTPWDPRDSLERSRLIVLLGSNLWLGIYLASAAMTRRRQSLHDLATGTVVLNRPR